MFRGSVNGLQNGKLALKLNYVNPQLRNLGSCHISVDNPTDSQTPKGLVYLLGWTGCVDKNLKHYSDIYRKRGFSVIRYSPKASLIFGLDPREKMKIQSRKLVDSMYQHGLQDRPVFFHCFSNGGAVMYYLLCQRLAEEGNEKVKFRGSIFDSAPSSMSYTLSRKAISTVAPGNGLSKMTIGHLGGMWVYFFLGYNKAKDFFTRDKTTELYRYYVCRSLSRQINMGPQLFLFSKNDKVIHHDGIEWFIEERRKRGVDVTVRRWEKSPHVKHYQTHPDEYDNLIGDFILKCAGSVSTRRLTTNESIIINPPKVKLNPSIAL